MSNGVTQQGFNRSLSEALHSEQVFDALYQLTDTLVGAKLFTIMRVDMDAMLASRAYSSDAENYPASGIKPVEMNRWFEIVHGQQQCFVANTLADIATVFPDHELIGSLGCGSVVNLPVVLGRKLVATINILDVEHHYTPERVEMVRQDLLLPSLAAILFAERRR